MLLITLRNKRIVNNLRCVFLQYINQAGSKKVRLYFSRVPSGKLKKFMRKGRFSVEVKLNYIIIAPN